jgi:hypothetical protein
MELSIATHGLIVTAPSDPIVYNVQICKTRAIVSDPIRVQMEHGE